MIDKIKCRELLFNKEFVELYKYFEMQYKELLDELLMKEGFNSKNLNFTQTMVLATNNLDYMFDLLVLISEIVFDADKGIYDRLDLLMEIYTPLKNIYLGRVNADKKLS